MHRGLLLSLLSFLLAETSLVGQVRVLCHTAVRKTAWVNCFDEGKRKILGTVELEYGAPVWKASYGDLSQFRGKRLRFGSGAFATAKLAIGMRSGEVRIAAGTYYLVFDCDAKGVWSVVFLPVERVKAAEIPPYRSEQTRGMGIRLPLRHKTAKKSVDRLTVEFAARAGGAGRLQMHVRFGPHRFTAPVDLAVPVKKDG